MTEGHYPRGRILCLVTDAYGGNGGIALFNRDVIQALCDNPDVVNVTVVPRVISTIEEPAPAKAVVDRSGLGGIAAYVRSVLRHVMGKERYSMVYCAHVNLIPLAWLAAKLLRIPWVLCLYGVEAWVPLPRRLNRHLAAKADLVLSISTVTESRFRSWCPVDPARCHLLPNAIKAEDYALTAKDIELTERFGLSGRTVVMTVGRLSELEQAKGFDRVIAALPAVRAEIPDICYVIVGEGGDRARLETLARETGVADAVKLVGFIPEDQKMKAYSLADAYVMPSTGEGFGFVYLEAMACGIPVVGSSIDGSAEALRHGELGQLVDPDDRDGLVKAILTAVRQPRAIPDGLSYFSFANFSARLNAALATLGVRH